MQVIPVRLQSVRIHKQAHPTFWLTTSLRWLFQSYRIEPPTGLAVTILHEAIRQAEIDGNYRFGD
jgi:hypothetical protein